MDEEAGGSVLYCGTRFDDSNGVEEPAGVSESIVAETRGSATMRCNSWSVMKLEGCALEIITTARLVSLGEDKSIARKNANQSLPPYTNCPACGLKWYAPPTLRCSFLQGAAVQWQVLRCTVHIPLHASAKLPGRLHPSDLGVA